MKLPQSQLDPERQCPRLERPVLTPFVPKPGEQVAEDRTMSPGLKSREVAASFGSLTPPSYGTAVPSANALTGLGYQQR